MMRMMNNYGQLYIFHAPLSEKKELEKCLIVWLTAIGLIWLVGWTIHFAIASQTDVDARAKVALPLILGTDLGGQSLIHRCRDI